MHKAELQAAEMKKFLLTIFKAAIIKIVGIGLAFAFILIVARNTNDVEYGTFAALFSASTILGFGLVAGQHVVVMRFWPSTEETYSTSVADMTLRWSLKIVAIACALGSLITIAALCLYAEFSDHAVTWSNTIWPLIAMSLSFAISEFSQGALRARGEFVVSLAGREILWRILAISTIVYIGEMSGSTSLFISAATLSIVNLFQLWLTFRRIQKPTNLSTMLRKDLRSTTYWIWMSTTIGPLVTHSGTVVVALALGPVSAGVFFAADRLAKLLSIALIAVNQALGPSLSREWHSGRTEKVQEIVTMSSIAAGTIAILGAITFYFMGEFALSLFSPSYSEAQNILMILALGQIVNSICGPNTMLMNMAGLEKSNTYIATITGALGILAIFIGATYFGILGAAIAHSLSVTCRGLVSVIKCRNALSILPISFRK